MSPAVIALIEGIIQLAIQLGPELVKEGQLAISLLKSGKDPTADEQAQIDAALDAVNAKLNAALGG